MYATCSSEREENEDVVTAFLARTSEYRPMSRQALIDRSKTVTVGISQHLMDFVPARRWHPIDQALTRLADSNFNHALLEALTGGAPSARSAP